MSLSVTLMKRHYNQYIYSSNSNSSSRVHASSPEATGNLRWKGFVEKIGFESRVKSDRVVDGANGDDRLACVKWIQCEEE